MVIVPTTGDSDTATLANLLLTGKKNTPPDTQQSQLQSRQLPGELLIGDTAGAAFFTQAEPMDRPDIVDGLNEAGLAPVAVVFSPPPLIRSGLIMLLGPTFPPQLGGGLTVPVLGGFRAATLAVDSPPDGGVRLSIRCASKQSAQVIRDQLSKSLSIQRENLPKAAANRIPTSMNCGWPFSRQSIAATW